MYPVDFRVILGGRIIFVNISNDLNFSWSYEPQWVASKAYIRPFGTHSLCTRLTAVHTYMNVSKMNASATKRPKSDILTLTSDQRIYCSLHGQLIP